jgi:putative ABC transport system substrate-binding protein
VMSLARPGGNITGSTRMSPDLSRKRFEILKEAVPKTSRVAVIFSTTTLLDKDELREMESEALRVAVKVQSIDVRDRREIQGAFTAVMRERADALIILQGAFTNAYRTELTELAANKRLPSMCETEAWTEDGCLISYGPDDVYPYHRAAIFVDKIFKGAKPADLPVEQPKKFELIINLKTAKQIGVTISPTVLTRADRVIR